MDPAGFLVTIWEHVITPNNTNKLVFIIMTSTFENNLLNPFILVYNAHFFQSHDFQIDKIKSLTHILTKIYIFRFQQ